MWKQSILLTLIFHIVINDCHSSLTEDIAETSAECLTNSLETSFHCRSSRVINKIIDNLSKFDKPIVIVRGLEIVPSNRHNNVATDNSKYNVNKAAGDAAGVTDGDTFLGRFSHYLRTHELNIKFSDLLSSEESELLLARDAEQNGIKNNSFDESRKKDKGNSMIMVLALMLSKMMAVIGLGGVGALAIKALGVAMTALMMATVVGLKSMAHQANESSHSVQYVTTDSHHHQRRRRRRSTDNDDFLKTPSLNIIFSQLSGGWGSVY